MRLPLVGGELGGVVVGVLAARVVERLDALVGVVEDAPDKAEADDLGGAGARLGLRLWGRDFFLLLGLLFAVLV